MSRRKFLGILLCLATLTIAAPTTAHACSCGGTSPVIYTGEGEIPRDLGGIAVWRGDAGFDSSYDWFIEVERWSDGAWRAESATVEELVDPGGFERYESLAFVRPEPFEEGDRFRVRAGFEVSSVEPVEAEVEVGPPLSTIVGRSKLLVGDAEMTTLRVSSGGSCYIEAWSVTREVDVELPTGLAPYRDLLLYETTIDGEPWRPATSLCSPNPIGRSWQAEPGTDLLAAACAYPYHDYETNLLESGAFSVQIHAYFPGASHPVWSTPEVQADLTCPADCVEFDYHTDEFLPCPPGADAGSSVDERPDAGPTGGGVDAAASGKKPRRAKGCATTDGVAGWPLLLVAVLGFFRRRRES